MYAHVKMTVKAKKLKVYRILRLNKIKERALVKLKAF